ncbi:MAG TPA: twin-arginine translocation pathway signal [Pseudolabrys sp.]|nr:twin-arginine translocation pathway signal [Pseudolabrys sp.]
MSRMNGGCTAAIAAVLLSAGLLGGCAMSDERAASLLVAPGDYEIYSCPQLAVTYAGLKARRIELEGLMAKAEGGAGGQLVNAVGYRPDYLKVRGEQHEIEKTAREKNCDLGAVPAGAAPVNAAMPPLPAAPGLVQPQPR